MLLSSRSDVPEIKRRVAARPGPVRQSPLPPPGCHSGESPGMASRLPSRPCSAVATCGQGTRTYTVTATTLNARQEVLLPTAERRWEGPFSHLGEPRHVAPGPAVPPRRGSGDSTHHRGWGRASGDRLLHERCPVTVTKDSPGPCHCAAQALFVLPQAELSWRPRRAGPLDGWARARVGREGR